jgi:hypothetical protein
MTPVIFLVALTASMPTTNIDHACQAAKAGAAVSDQKNAFDSCVHDETAARDELKQKWGTFSVRSKDDCAEPKGVSFSYVELLTCLEMQVGQFNPPQTTPITPAESASPAPAASPTPAPAASPPAKQP